MKKMFSIIKQHNIKIVSSEGNEKHICKCRNIECCLLEGNCLKEYIVCEAKLSSNFNDIMVHVKENLNLVFLTTRNHFEI